MTVQAPDGIRQVLPALQSCRRGLEGARPKLPRTRTEKRPWTKHLYRGQCDKNNQNQRNDQNNSQPEFHALPRNETHDNTCLRKVGLPHPSRFSKGGIHGRGRLGSVPAPVGSEPRSISYRTALAQASPAARW